MTLSFVTPLVDMKFDMFPDVLVEHFFAFPVGDFVVAKRVYRGCPILLSNRVTLVDLVELICWTLMSYWVWICYMLIFLQFIVE